MNSEEKKSFQTLVIPFLLEEELEENGRKIMRTVRNLEQKEIDGMSCEPKLLLQNSDGDYYLSPLPIVYKSNGGGINRVQVFSFDDLTEEERVKYANRAYSIEVVNYDVASKSTRKTASKKSVKSPKKRVKRKEKNTSSNNINL